MQFYRKYKYNDEDILYKNVEDSYNEKKKVLNDKEMICNKPSLFIV